MMPAIVMPMAAHVALTAMLYVVLTLARAPSVWGLGRRAEMGSPLAAAEPRISANLSNQFEWPLLFHVACLLAMQLQLQSPWLTGFAWLFIAGRLIHSTVHICTTNVRLRGLVFTINFLAVLGMWVALFLEMPKSA